MCKCIDLVHNKSMKKFFLFLLIINIFLIDIAVGFILYDNYLKKQREDQGGGKSMINVEDSSIPLTLENGCDEACRQELVRKVEEMQSEIEIIGENVNSISEVGEVAVPVSSVVKTKSVSYLPIPGSGNVLNTNWTDISGTDFYMSKSDYPGLVSINFEANLKLLNGNGVAYLRIYDMTNAIGVSGSEISTSNQTSTFVSSSNINMWSGYNHYKVQARSLTADTTVFESGRLKIITEN